MSSVAEARAAFEEFADNFEQALADAQRIVNELAGNGGGDDPSPTAPARSARRDGTPEFTTRALWPMAGHARGYAQRSAAPDAGGLEYRAAGRVEAVK